MRKLTTLFAIPLLASLLIAQHLSAQTLMRVYVQAGAGGFAASGANDTALDLRKALNGKSRTLRLVESPEEADLIVRIDSRDVRKETAAVNTYENQSKNGRSTTSTTVPTIRNIDQLHATLIAGDFQMPMHTESALSWRLAAGDMASTVDHWVKENYATLIEKRTQRPQQPGSASLAPAGPVASDTAQAPQGDEAAITPGMTEKQVLKVMGNPDKKIAFGKKSMWNYRGMQVVFEDGKVADVKF